MSDKLKAELDAIFSAHEGRQKQAQAQQLESEARAVANLESFHQLQDSLIRPTFEKIGEAIKARGYDYRIDVHRASTDPNGKHLPPRIFLHFLISNTPDRAERNHPYFMLSCERHTGNVNLFKSTMSPSRGGFTGGFGSIRMSEVTAEALEEKTLGILREVLT